LAGAARICLAGDCGEARNGVAECGTWQAIQQFRALNPHVGPHSHVVFLHVPFSESDMLFPADLFPCRSSSPAIFFLADLLPRRSSSSPIQGSAIAESRSTCNGPTFNFLDGKLLRLR
jgi:hypothetical protein